MALQDAQFAGSFYTGEPVPLNRHVRLLIEGAKVGRSITADHPLAIVAPHAGFRFSGHIAAQAYGAALTAEMANPYARVVVLSPSHKHAFDGIALPSWRGIKVPNGRMAVDRLVAHDLRDRGLAIVNDAAHENEHGIETQVPFLARYFRQASLVPLVVGRTSAQAVARVIDHLTRDPETRTLVVISSDLSHFHPRAKAHQLDAATAQLVETGQTLGLDGTHACGWLPLSGLLCSNLVAGAKPVRLAMDDSSRATGDTSRVVGYGAWAFYPAKTQLFNAARRKNLLSSARQGLRSFLAKGRKPKINDKTFSAPLHTTLASFVTLSQDGALRGCIGSLRAHQPLVHDVVANAIKAGTADARFARLTDPGQLDQLTFKVAVLTQPTPVSCPTKADAIAALTPGQTGLILEDQGKRGTFLPMVWDGISDRDEFVTRLIQKAGLPPGHWSGTMRVWQFETESFSEDAPPGR